MSAIQKYSIKSSHRTEVNGRHLLSKRVRWSGPPARQDVRLLDPGTSCNGQSLRDAAGELSTLGIRLTVAVGEFRHRR